jgi:hypothetical protein
LAGYLHRQCRHRRYRDRHRDEIGQDRHRTAQQAGVEAGGDSDQQCEINDGIEAVHRKKSLPVVSPPDAWSMNRVCDR